MGPGDRVDAAGALRRVSPLRERDEELAAIAAYAARVQDTVVAAARRVPPARPDVAEQFRDYILRLWRAARDALPGVRRHVIAYVLAGEPERRFYFDFSQPETRIFQWGEPPRYDMRYTYPADFLQLRLDGAIDWDELHFTADVRVHQIEYARDFYVMLRGEMLER
jgi:hypothetical protein